MTQMKFICPTRQRQTSRHGGEKNLMVTKRHVGMDKLGVWDLADTKY